jgi:hypothetical protein
MTLVCILHASDDFAATGVDVSHRPLKRLNAGLLIDRKQQRVLRRIQIQADNIGGFRLCLRNKLLLPCAFP